MKYIKVISKVLKRIIEFTIFTILIFFSPKRSVSFNVKVLPTVVTTNFLGYYNRRFLIRILEI